MDARLRYDMTWLRAEAAVSASVHEDKGLDTGGVELSPAALLDEAAGRFEVLAEDPKTPVLVRARSYIGLGGITHYRGAIDVDKGVDVQDLGPCRESYHKAGEIVMRLANTKKSDPRITHLAQVLSFLGVLRTNADNFGMLGLPVPDRLSALHDERRFDMVLWDVSRTGALWRAAVTTQERSSRIGRTVLSPQLLDESGYPSGNGHGMLQAVLDADASMIQRGQARGSQPQYGVRMAPGAHADRRRQGLKKYFRDSVLRIGHEIADQIERRSILAFKTDPIEGLDDARTWYAGLPPLRRLTEYDMPALEQCINPFEVAQVSGELSLADTNTLGWLHTELGVLPGAEGGLDRAEDLFAATAQAATEAEDWSAYSEALAGGVTSKLYKKLAAGGYEPAVLAQEYCADLAGAISTLHEILERLQSAGLQAEPAAEAAHIPAVWRTLQRLTTCLIISSDAEPAQIAATANPRQRAAALGELGFDTIVMPQLYATETFSPHAIGRLQMVAGKHDHLKNLGVATTDPALLGQVIDGLERTPDGLTWDTVLATRTRQRMVDAARSVQFL